MAEKLSVFILDLSKSVRGETERSYVSLYLCSYNIFTRTFKSLYRNPEKYIHYMYMKDFPEVLRAHREVVTSKCVQI